MGLDAWKTRIQLKVSSVGFLTGLPGGPVGLMLEGGDISYLMSVCGRACYGVGYIIRDEVDYEKLTDFLEETTGESMATYVSGCGLWYRSYRDKAGSGQTGSPPDEG